MSQKKKERAGRRPMTVRVTPMTYKHLCDLASIAGLQYPGQAVDKMVKQARIAERDARRGVWRSE